MIELYPANAKQEDFIWNGETLRHAYDSHVFRDDIFYTTFKLKLDKEEQYKNVKRGMIIKTATPKDSLNNAGTNEFRIWDITKRNDHIEIEALSLIYDWNVKQVGPIKVMNGSLKTAIEQFKEAFQSGFEPFTLSSYASENRTFNTEEAEGPTYNALDIFNTGAHSIVGTWAAEIMINGYDIRLVDNIGISTQALLYEHKNISDFENIESNKELCTRIHAVSTFTPTNEEGNSTSENEKTLHVVVDSPLINDYEQIYEKQYVNNDLKTEEELTKWAKAKYINEKIDLPKRSIKVVTNIIDDTEINYGDTLVLKYLKHDVDEEIRCVGYDYDGINGEFYSITLGSSVTSLGGTINTTIRDLTSDSENKTYNTIQTAANGKNKIFRSTIKPTTGIAVNDLWYKPVGEGEVEMYIFNGTTWHLESYSADALKGTVNFANINAINFNAANIVSGTISSIDIEGTTITNPFDYTDGDGIRVVGTNTIGGIYTIDYEYPSNGQYGQLRMDSRRIYSEHRNSSGKLLYSWDIGGAGINMITADGTANYSVDGIAFEPTKGEKSIINTSNAGKRLQLSSKNGAVLGVTTNDLFSERLVVGTTNGVPFVKSVAPFDVDGNDIQNIERMMFRWGKGRLIGLDSGNHLGVFGGTRLRLGVGGDLRTLIEIGDNIINAYSNIDMGGNTITNQSDIRLKTEVNDTLVDGIKETKKIRMIDFDWDKSNPFNSKKPDGRQFGLEAQHSKFLQTEISGEDHYLRIDVNKQMNLNTLTNKQLIERVESLEERLEKLENLLENKE